MSPADSLRPIENSELKITEGVDEGMVSKFLNVKSLEDLPKWDWGQLFSIIGPKS